MTATTDILGYTSTTIFILLFIPQVIKTTKLKTAKDISFLFLFLNFIGCCLMIAYSVLLNLDPVLLSNSVMLVMNTYLLIFKYLEIIEFFKIYHINLDQNRTEINK